MEKQTMSCQIPSSKFLTCLEITLQDEIAKSFNYWGFYYAFNRGISPYGQILYQNSDTSNEICITIYNLLPNLEKESFEKGNNDIIEFLKEFIKYINLVVDSDFYQLSKRATILADLSLEIKMNSAFFKKIWTSNKFILSYKRVLYENELKELRNIRKDFINNLLDTDASLNTFNVNIDNFTLKKIEKLKELNANLKS